MNSDPTETTASIGTAGGDPGGQPSEEELRAAYEAEMSRITSTDMVLQATVSLLNIGGYRLGLSGPPGGSGHGDGEQDDARDLEQVRDAIDAARALLPILERRRPGELRPLRDALAQLQMAYAREAGTPSAAAAEPRPAATPAQDQTQPPRPQPPAGGPASAGEPKPEQPGPAEASGRLWVPGR